MRKLNGRFFISLIGVVLASFVLSGCFPEPPEQNQKTTQSQKAKNAADSITFSENAEIDNIKQRLELTSQPGLLGYVILLNEAGQPIVYEGVKGKITSGGKRLTAPIKHWKVDKGEWNGTEMNVAPSDEGTWGSSSPYIFYWNINGEYRQWSGTYLYSDKPFRLNVEPLVINVESPKVDTTQAPVKGDTPSAN